MKTSSDNEPAGSGPPPPLVRTTASARSSTTMVTARILHVLLFSTIAAAQSLPYIPTSIFLPAQKTGQSQDNATTDIAYIFSPRDDSVDLLALNVSSSLSASSLSLQTLSSGLPFLNGTNTAFVPSLADNGSLIVYTGDCSLSTNPEIWTFDPSVINGAASSSWAQQSATIATDGDTMQIGPSFLGGSFSFSTTLEPEVSRAKTFVYGGMCPESGANATSSQWRATYSNQMIRIAPSDSDSSGYAVDPVASKGPPVPEAGFTFTALSPSIANRSGTVTQQVNYVLLGGHTANAFINMSTAAIWSLPEESWGFITDIGVAGSVNANTELAVKSATVNIDSRSGHTAVLNENGTALIIYGGWVGDLTQAASPQLAILEIGTGYGGDGDWQWSVPDSQPSGPGIYGHGATLLPGNVMMIYGGYDISPSGNTKRASSTGSTSATFLNLTSLTWAEDYTNPYSENAEGSSGDSEDTKKRLGLGLGIGLGVFAIIAAVVVYFLYRRRLRSKRTIRDSAIRALAQDNSRFLPHDDDDEQGWYGPYMSGGRSLGYRSLQSERVSMDNSRQHWFGDMPPMQQIPRKPVAPRAARGQYQAMPSGPYDSSPTSVRSPGGMGPIYEADEDGGDIASEPISPMRDSYTDVGYHSDPFSTPTNERALSFPAPSRAPRTPSPRGRRGSVTDPDVQDWMTDVDAADALLSGLVATTPRATTGRASPARRTSIQSNNRPATGRSADDDASRTGSNISESNRSNLVPSRGGGSEGEHLRAGAAATAEERGGSSGSSSVPSYNTAKSSFTALQAEGPALLLGRIQERERNHYEDDNNNEYYYPAAADPGSPSKSKPRRSWFGSLRRVFSGATPSPSPPGTGNSSREENDPFYDGGAGIGEASDFDSRLGGLGSIAADGLLRRKGGRGAWEEVAPRDKDAGGAAGPSQTGGGGGGGAGLGERDDSEEWDIEKAVEKRLVQVLFTVPKERLRVVNAEPEIECGESAVVVDPERYDDDDDDDDDYEDSDAADDREKGREGGLGALLSTPSSHARSGVLLRDHEEQEEEEESGGGGGDPEKEALRRELDAEWARAEAEVGSDRQSLLDREIEALGRELQLDNERSRRKRENDGGAATTASASTTTTVVAPSSPSPPPPPHHQPPPSSSRTPTTLSLTTTTTITTATATTTDANTAAAMMPLRARPSLLLLPAPPIPVLTPPTRAAAAARAPTTPESRSPSPSSSSAHLQPRSRRSTTRVRAMIEDIESKSREGSPAGSSSPSPTRSPARGEARRR
ncbi:hypothetical protein F4809DRAFT_643921 [Biscogniauxia mediterranea]|nr:hypothetical protein F4809DRAFT_643921 [Biscogniauxia mediterranea]